RKSSARPDPTGALPQLVGVPGDDPEPADPHARQNPLLQHRVDRPAPDVQPTGDLLNRYSGTRPIGWRHLSARIALYEQIGHDYLSVVSILGLKGCSGSTVPPSLIHLCSVAGPFPVVVKLSSPATDCCRPWLLTATEADGFRPRG